MLSRLSKGEVRQRYAPMRFLRFAHLSTLQGKSPNTDTVAASLLTLLQLPLLHLLKKYNLM